MTVSETQLTRQTNGFADEEIAFRETRRAVANGKLTEYRNQCWRLANLARRGIVQRSNAVDLLFEVALGHALVRSLGEDRITAIIGEAFADADFRPMAAEAMA